MNIAILVISTASLVVSVATLTVVLVGAKKANEEISGIRTRTSRAMAKIQEAFGELG